MSESTTSQGSVADALHADSDWVYRCAGFDVESPGGLIGTVDEVRYDPSRRWDSPNALAVQAGRSGRLLLIIPIDQIAEIVGEERRVVLRSSPNIVAIERR